MRATFDDAGSGGCAQPAHPAGGFRRAYWAVILVILSFGWGTVIAAAYDAFCDQQAHDVTDRGDGWL